MERKLLEKVLDNMEDTDLTYDRIQKLIGKLKKREKEKRKGLNTLIREMELSEAQKLPNGRCDNNGSPNAEGYDENVEIVVQANNKTLRQLQIKRNV